MGKLFGTDGVRGLANRDITGELALALCAAAAQVLARETGHRPVAVVGRDTRRSGVFLSHASIAGLTSAGADVLDAGVLPTPAVAHLVASIGADLGVMISASHNPAPDNGIKLFGPGGQKLPDDVEAAIEEIVLAGEHPRVLGPEIGLNKPFDGRPAQPYVDHLVSTVPPDALARLKVVVDCANGAAFWAAPQVYRAAGAEVIALFDQPNGDNINDGCGSTHLEPLRAAVVEHGADLGIAHDGDADRCLAVDATGAVVDGDQLMGILAIALREAGSLSKDTLVATVMSNAGLRRGLASHGVTVVDDVPPGDRYVLERLAAGGFNFGGEQSGHIVFREHATTGDGILTALQLMARMAAVKQPLADLASVIQPLPQVLLNVPAPRTAAADPAVLAQIEAVTAALGDDGRVLVRPSGTEPLVRVMVEAVDAGAAQSYAEQIATAVRAV